MVLSRASMIYLALNPADILRGIGERARGLASHACVAPSHEQKGPLFRRVRAHGDIFGSSISDRAMISRQQIWSGRPFSLNW